MSKYDKPLRTLNYETRIIHAYYVEYERDCICTLIIKDYHVQPLFLIRELQAAIEWLGEL